MHRSGTKCIDCTKEGYLLNLFMQHSSSTYPISKCMKCGSFIEESTRTKSEDISVKFGKKMCVFNICKIHEKLRHTQIIMEDDVIWLNRVDDAYTRWY